MEVLENPVDAVWEEMGRPAPPTDPIWLLNSGETTVSKINQLRTSMVKKGTAVAVVSALDDVAWLMNLRGGDIPYTPLFLAYCVVSDSTVTLCCHLHQLDAKVVPLLAEANVQVRPYDAVVEVLETVASSATNKNVWLDPLSANWHLKASCTSLGLVVKSDQPLPIALSKAVKNALELTSIQQAHVVDGVALSKYFCWLENEMMNDTFELDEVQAADR